MYVSRCKMYYLHEFVSRFQTVTVGLVQDGRDVRELRLDAPLLEFDSTLYAVGCRLKSEREGSIYMECINNYNNRMNLNSETHS